MTHPDDLRAADLAASYVRAYLETDATFEEIVSHFGDGPDDYVGRRRARECPDPHGHDRLYRASEDRLRKKYAGFDTTPPDGRCGHCDGLLPEED